MSRSPHRHQIHQRPRLLALAAFFSALAVASISPAKADQIQAPKKPQQQAKPIVAKIESDGLGDGFSVIRDQAGNRIGTIQDDGVTGRAVVYDKRGQRIGTIDREEDPAAGDFASEASDRE